MAGSVADLFATLGLKPRKNEWDKGNTLIDGLRGKLKKLGQDGKKALTNQSSMMSGFKKLLIGLGAAFAVNKIKSWVQETANAADAAKDASVRLGITTEAVQELGYAAKLSSSDWGELEPSLRRFSASIGHIKDKSSKDFRKTLKEIGVSAKSFKGKTLDEQFEIVSTAFTKLKKPAKAGAYAMELFGKTGAKLVPLLKEGGKGIQDLRKEAHEFGAVIEDDAVNSLADFNDDQDRLKFTLDGLRNQIVIGLLPAIRGMLTDLLAWVRANKDLIASGIAGFAKALIVVLKGVALAIGLIVKGFEWLTENSEVLIGMISALGAVMIASAAPAAAAWLTAAAPFIAIGAAVTGVLIAVKLLVKHFPMIWTTIKKALGKAWAAVKDFGSNLLEFFKGIGRAFAAPFIWVYNKIKDVIGWIFTKVQQAVEMVKNAAKEFSEFFWGGETAFDKYGKLVKSGELAARKTENAQKMRSVVSGAASVPVGPNGVGSGFAAPPVTSNMTVNITQQPGQDAKAVADELRPMVNEELRKNIRQAGAGTGFK